MGVHLVLAMAAEVVVAVMAVAVMAAEVVVVEVMVAVAEGVQAAMEVSHCQVSYSSLSLGSC